MQEALAEAGLEAEPRLGCVHIDDTIMLRLQASTHISVAEESQQVILEYLDLELLKIAPATRIVEYIANVDDIYRRRAILKECRWDFESFDYLLSIFARTMEAHLRFLKQADCFKVIRVAIRRAFVGCRFPKPIVDKLFYLYAECVRLNTAVNSDIVDWLSVALKDQVLDRRQVDWLIENVAQDETILNRLLRYPTRDEAIEKWALASMGSDTVEGRESELYGLLINDNIPEALKGKDKDQLAWGIYYSRNDRETKERLLLEIVGKSNYRSVCGIANRLNLPNVVRKTIEKIGRELGTR